MKNELEAFLERWERESAKTISLLEGLPQDGYDFRPDPEGRSLGELAWHLAEPEAYGSFGIERGAISADARPPGFERPRTVSQLAPGFEHVHREALARVQKLKPEDLDRSITFITGQPIAVRDVLWDFILLHGIHHRGQLAMMSRQAGGRVPSLYGPTRETRPLRQGERPSRPQ